MPPTKEVVKFIKNDCFNITYKFDWHPSTFKSLLILNLIKNRTGQRGITKYNVGQRGITKCNNFSILLQESLKLL